MSNNGCCRGLPAAMCIARPHGCSDGPQEQSRTIVPGALGAPSEDDLKRWHRFVNILPNGCHEWTGARSKGKRQSKHNSWYGSFWYQGRTIRAHRFACEVIGGREPLPEGHERAHICHFSMCVNEAHIEYQPSEINRKEAAKRRRSN